MMSYVEAIDLIRQERNRQNRKWGVFFPRRPDEKWFTILAEEFGEIANAMLEHKTDDEIEAEIIQVAAVCVSWLQFRGQKEAS